MQVILRTLVKNKLATDRKLRWCKGWVEARGSVLLEGAYPTACETEADAVDMQAEIDSKTIEVTLITNLPTGAPVGGPGSVLNAKAQEVKVAADKVKTETKEPVKTQKEIQAPKMQEDEGFLNKGTIEEHLPGAISLAGDEGVPPQPETRSIFTDRKEEEVGDQVVTETVTDDPLVEFVLDEAEGEEIEDTQTGFDLDAERARLEAEEEAEKEAEASEPVEEAPETAEEVKEPEKGKADEVDYSAFNALRQAASGEPAPETAQEDTQVSETDFPEMSGAALALADESDLTAEQINSIKGTGADGRVVKKDVQSYLDSL